MSKIFFAVLFASFILTYFPANIGASGPKYVIEISVDGLGSSYLKNLLDQNKLPNFNRLKNEGSSTLNARSDCEITVTLPNHVGMISGRAVIGAAGHNWTINGDPSRGQTLHSNKGAYVSSVFDVVHDHGLRTAMYATKTKFSLFDSSYNSINGADDAVCEDNGKDKIDTYSYNSNSAVITKSFITDMNANPFNYSFIHYTNGDTAGHAHGWGSRQYDNAIIAVDGYLGSILNFVENNAALKNNTFIILTADHGGKARNHSDCNEPLDYTIPFFVWGPCITGGSDLYTINVSSRRNPGTGRPDCDSLPAPIRNGDGANLALKLLGMPPIPGSTINRSQNLKMPRNSAEDLNIDCLFDFSK